MKTAYFIIGCESSGTRMLTMWFTDKGIFGSSDHQQKLDSLRFEGRPDRIVFRRSVPHAGMWVDRFGDIVAKMELAGYEIVFIVITRQRKYNALSQVKRGHTDNLESAYSRIDRGRKEIDAFIADKSFCRLDVQYEDFVDNPEYRYEIANFLQLLTWENITLYNANTRYDNE